MSGRVAAAWDGICGGDAEEHRCSKCQRRLQKYRKHGGQKTLWRAAAEVEVITKRVLTYGQMPWSSPCTGTDVRPGLHWSAPNFEGGKSSRNSRFLWCRFRYSIRL